MNASRFVMAALVLVSVPPAISADGSLVGCDVRTSEAYSPDGETYVSGVYASGTTAGTDAWRESNGIDGLQKVPTYCADGRYYPADSCVSTVGSPTCARQAVFETI